MMTVGGNGMSDKNTNQLNAVIFEGDIQRGTKGAAEALGASIWEGLRYYTIEKLEKSVRERDSQPQATERDRLAGLLEAAMLTALTVKTELKETDFIADYLLAHGVTLEKEKRETKLDGKCGSCKWAEAVESFGGSKCYVRCKNENAQCNRRKRNDLTPVRQRTCPACKLYERREG